MEDGAGECEGWGEPVDALWLAARACFAAAEAAASVCLPFLPGAGLGAVSPLAIFVWRATERA